MAKGGMLCATGRGDTVLLQKATARCLRYRNLKRSPDKSITVRQIRFYDEGTFSPFPLILYLGLGPGVTRSCFGTEQQIHERQK